MLSSEALNFALAHPTIFHIDDPAQAFEDLQAMIRWLHPDVDPGLETASLDPVFLPRPAPKDATGLSSE